MDLLDFKVETPLRKYESVLILHPHCTLHEQQIFFRKQREIIKKYSGSIHHIDTWGKRRLTHSIKAFRIGIYFHITFEALPDCILELERILRINDKVLRFMHTKIDSRISFEKHIENYRATMALSVEREQERELRRQKKFNAYKSQQTPLEYN